MPPSRQASRRCGTSRQPPLHGHRLIVAPQLFRASRGQIRCLVTTIIAQASLKVSLKVSLKICFCLQRPGMRSRGRTSGPSTSSGLSPAGSSASKASGARQRSRSERSSPVSDPSKTSLLMKVGLLVIGAPDSEAKGAATTSDKVSFAVEPACSRWKSYRPNGRTPPASRLSGP
jgi:hypothetical protein